MKPFVKVCESKDEELGAFLVEWLFEEICWLGGRKKGR